MPNMLNGAAFDDNEDEDDDSVVPRRPHRVNQNLPHPIGNEEDVSDTWDFGFMSERSGVLIVPPDELENAVAAGPDDRYETDMALSVPGTDSFPSELGSLHDLNGSINAPAREETAEERLIDRDQGGEIRLNWCSKTISLLLVAMLVASFLSSAFLFSERQTWHDTALRLEEKIRQLEEQHAQHAIGQNENPPPVNTLRLEENIRQLEARAQAQQAKGQTEDPPSVFSWEKSGGAEDPEPTLLVDNCWLHAKANLELGKCANDAKENAKKTFNEVLNKVDDVGKTWIKYMAGEEPGSAKSESDSEPVKPKGDIYSSAKITIAKKTLKEFSKTVAKEGKRFKKKVDDVGKTWIEYLAREEPDSEAVPVEPTGDVNSSEVNKTTNARSKAITDTAKTIASGLVYASLVFVVVDEAFAYFMDHSGHIQAQ